MVRGWAGLRVEAREWVIDIRWVVKYCNEML